jgi:hypothetical protein
VATDRQDARDDDREDDDVPPIAPASHRGPRAKEPKRRSKQQTFTDSTTRTIDIAALIRAGAQAVADGAAQSRHTVDSTTTALTQAYAQVAAKDAALNEKDRTINALHAQILALSAQNPTVALLHVQAEAAKLEAEAKKHETNRRWDGIERLGPKIARELGPNAGSILAAGAALFGVKLPVPPVVAAPPTPADAQAGPAVPASASVPAPVRHVFLWMTGEDVKAQAMLGIFRTVVADDCGEDFDAVMTYLTGIDHDDATAETSPTANAPGAP